MMRLYIAFWDNGHDRGEFEFYSSHRANSKANLQDAMRTYHRKFGYSNNIMIYQVYLKER